MPSVLRNFCILSTVLVNALAMGTWIKPADKIDTEWDSLALALSTEVKNRNVGVYRNIDRDGSMTLLTYKLLSNYTGVALVEIKGNGNVREWTGNFMRTNLSGIYLVPFTFPENTDSPKRFDSVVRESNVAEIKISDVSELLNWL